MKRLLLMAALGVAHVAALASPAQAQALPAVAESTTTSHTVLPLTEAPATLQAELLARQEARLENLEADLAACRAAQPAAPAATNLPQPAQAYVPAPRYSGGFRVAPEQKLTCDDYSASYFARHPVMAKVCGVELEPSTQPASQPESPEAPTAEPAPPAS